MIKSGQMPYALGQQSDTPDEHGMQLPLLEHVLQLHSSGQRT